MSINSATIIIRSVGERTQSLCKNLILDQGVSEEAVFVINQAPFSKALKVGFEIGLDEKKPWTFCVDADLLLRSRSILNMIEHAERQPSNVCELQGFVLDKLYGGARKGGIHLYRTSLLDKMIKCIPSEGKDIRPETYALNAMQAAGYPWLTVPELIGLHDFEQTYEDLYRKCFVHAHKHLCDTTFLIPYWRSKSKQDLDYQIALVGFAEGIRHFGEVRIDKRAEYFQKAMKDLEISPKHAMDLSEWNLDRIEFIIQNWVEPIEYWEKYPIGMLVNSGSGILSRVIGEYKWHRSRSSFRDSAKSIVARLLIGAGNRLRRSSVSS